MVISVILISSDSSEESVGTSIARVILFGTIPTAIPTTIPDIDPPIVHDDIPLIPTETLTISPVAPTITYTSPFMYTDSSNNDFPDRPPSQDPYKVTVARWRSRVAARQPILVGRPYHTQPNGVRKMLTAKKRVRAPPVDHHSSDHSSSDHSLADHSSSGHSTSNQSLSGHSSPSHAAGPSRKRCKSPATIVPSSIPASGALSPTRSDILPPRKRFRDSYSLEDSAEEDIDTNVLADVAAIKAAAAVEVEARINAGIGIKVGVGVDRVDKGGGGGRVQ
ncbi:hypothetical protein Tco_1056439 [Tanacetum coccineum]|uniref:Uncharacterized protein n=1 Tax=Tanacetum coccineum TaxID=301880 RepID=A0ABQ5H2H9_9ASTR